MLCFLFNSFAREKRHKRVEYYSLHFTISIEKEGVNIAKDAY